MVTPIIYEPPGDRHGAHPLVFEAPYALSWYMADGQLMLTGFCLNNSTCSQ